MCKKICAEKFLRVKFALGKVCACKNFGCVFFLCSLCGLFFQCQNFPAFFYCKNCSVQKIICVRARVCLIYACNCIFVQSVGV